MLERLLPARPRWSDLGPTAASEHDIQRYRAAARAATKRRLAWAGGIALALAHLVAIAVMLGKIVDARARAAGERQRAVAADK